MTATPVRLLLVDDEPQIVRALSPALHAEGYVVDTAATGQAALHKMAADPSDLMNLDLGLPADARHYGAASQVLRDLGVTDLRLLTNNPEKSESLEDFGIHVVAQVPRTPRPNPHNLAYLRTKRDRMGHELPDLAPLEGTEPAPGHGVVR